MILLFTNNNFFAASMQTFGAPLQKVGIYPQCTFDIRSYFDYIKNTNTWCSQDILDQVPAQFKTILMILSNHSRFGSFSLSADETMTSTQIAKKCMDLQKNGVQKIRIIVDICFAELLANSVFHFIASEKRCSFVQAQAGILFLCSCPQGQPSFYTKPVEIMGRTASASSMFNRRLQFNWVHNLDDKLSWRRLAELLNDNPVGYSALLVGDESMKDDHVCNDLPIVTNKKEFATLLAHLPDHYQNVEELPKKVFSPSVDVSISESSLGNKSGICQRKIDVKSIVTQIILHYTKQNYVPLDEFEILFNVSLLPYPDYFAEFSGKLNIEVQPIEKYQIIEKMDYYFYQFCLSGHIQEFQQISEATTTDYLCSLFETPSELSES